LRACVLASCVCALACGRPHAHRIPFVYAYYAAASTGRVHMWTYAHAGEAAMEVALCLLSALGGGVSIKRAPGYALFPTLRHRATAAGGLAVAAFLCFLVSATLLVTSGRLTVRGPPLEKYNLEPPPTPPVAVRIDTTSGPRS
jgi:hypothetical protein